MTTNVEWFGRAGHLIVADRCQFHLCTLVGEYLVSTVGEYVPDTEVREIHCEVHGIRLEGRGDDRLDDYMKKVGFQEIGIGRTYETIVFKAKRCSDDECDCGGMPVPLLHSEIMPLDFRGYNSIREAHAGHIDILRKWTEVAELDVLARD